MGSMLELEKKVDELKRELKIEKATNKLVFTLLIQSIEVISPKQNVRDVLMNVVKEVTPAHISSSPDADEVIKRVEKIISKS